MANDVLNENGKNPYDPGKSAGENFKSVIRWAFRLRGVTISVPVAVLAVILALNSAAVLPGPMEIGAGQNVIILSKAVLIMGPLALTALSILMTLYSKRVVYPWLISIFTLLLPLALWFTMTFGI